ncbi:MAG: MTH938/NDUFAF3 family protein [Sedimentisphaerales bacterium]|jgi:hypothetical protein|nr:MTH938/NDUFAF3 family protein [Sedimentisphaerales bacterium]NLZ04007.1 hypothetical protein [Phycisphaerae bacterium]HNY80823.1 MTH938/NDUFAF3 family protein [Sedimentisphaerales bacterium]HOC65232.1 MTH938/NDUFAF3 family protein [Sedimentisphaerales bacterium]HOH65011.1 MTH938/NDUFAF3 family protein [Sedimentisphaerales bacterium]
MPASSEIMGTSFGEITIGKTTYETDVYVLASGEVKRRKKRLAKEVYGTSHKIGPAELKRICKGGPKKVFIGTGQSGVAELTPEGCDFLREHRIEFCALPTPELIDAYNKFAKPKAALIHVTC